MTSTIFKIIGVLGLTLAHMGVMSQSISVYCAPEDEECNVCYSYNIYTGTTCEYDVPGDYRLDGATFRRNYYDGEGNILYKRYSFSRSSPGAYTLTLRAEGGGLPLDTRTVNVYAPVGPVTITPPAGQTPLCSDTYSTSQYSAFASNATDYQWSLSLANPPGTPAPFITSSGLVNWNNYIGSATITVRAYNRYFSDVGQYGSTSANRIQSVNFNAGFYYPPKICEGEQIYLQAWSSHPASYEWYIDDNGTPVGTGSVLYPTLYTGNFVRLKAYPAGNLASQCVNAPTVFQVDSRLITEFNVTPSVFVSTISMPNGSFSERCQNENLITQFAATASYADNYTWSISPSNPANPLPTTHAGTISQTGLVTWNPDFYGTAWITFTATGCGPEAVSSKQITVKKIPSVFSVNHPVELCANATGLVQLAGSEPNVDYQLKWFYQLISQGQVVYSEWKNVPEENRQSPTSWNVLGTYRELKVVATPNNGCLPVEFPTFNIGLIPQSPITISVDNLTNFDGAVYACEYNLIRFTVTGGAPGTQYSWKANADKFCRENPDEVPDQPWMKPEFCHPRLDPYRDPNGPNDEIFFQVWPFANWFPIYATGTDATCNAFIKSNEIQVVPSPDFYPLGIEAGSEIICQGSGTTYLALDYKGLPNPNTIRWELAAVPVNGSTPSLGNTLLQHNGTSASIQWDPSFSGNTILTFAGTGCGTEKTLPKFLTVHKVLEDEENYVQSITANQPLQSPIDLFSNIHNVSKVNTVTSFFDGLGRNIQNVSAKLSPSSQDVVEVKQYDNYGRESKKFLPYSRSFSTSYNNAALLEQQNFYNTPPPGVQSDSHPFTITQYEASPLNRPMKQSNPGLAWQPIDETPDDLDDHTVKTRYAVVDDQEVIRFSYDEVSQTVNALENGQLRYYQPGSLKATKMYDEDNHQTIEYVDKEGRTVCKKVQYDLNGTTPLFASTYYVYDKKGLLVVVIPPEAINSALSQLMQN